MELRREHHAVGRRMNDVVATTMRRVSAVATLPAIALRVMRIAEDPAATSDAMFQVLASDPALSTRVLKVVNSAYYGRPRQVASTLAAIQLLGVGAIRNIAVAASLTRMFKGGRAVPGFDASALWIHSVAVGAAARRLADVTRKVAPDEALLAGLLHDIGVLIGLQAWLPEFTAVISATNDDTTLSFSDAEAQIIGATHEAFGAALCAQWQFPAALMNVCGHHHHPMALPASEQLLPALVHVADVLAARSKVGYARTVAPTGIEPGVLELLGIIEADLEAIVLALPEDASQAMALFAGS